MITEKVQVECTIDLLTICLNLPREKRERLYEALGESLGFSVEAKDDQSKNRVDILKGYLEVLLGYKEIKMKSHRKDFVTAKALICQQLHKEGLNYIQISRAMNMHHSSVMYLCLRAQDFIDFPRQFPYEHEIYVKLQNIIENEDTNKGAD